MMRFRHISANIQPKNLKNCSFLIQLLGGAFEPRLLKSSPYCYIF